MGIAELEAVRVAVAVMRATGTDKVRIPEEWLTGDLPGTVTWYYDLASAELVVRLAEEPVDTPVRAEAVIERRELAG